jgi:anti-sigma factor RsiW
MANDKQEHFSSTGGPITEADLHAYVDRQLTAARQAQVERYLHAHPQKRLLVQSWQQQNALLRASLNPVLDEAIPVRFPLRPAATAIPWRGLAAGFIVAIASAGAAWVARGAIDAQASRLAMLPSNHAAGAGSVSLAGFARRAAVAHVVYSPDVRRPVEVGADQEQQLVNWLSKRLGTALKPPALQGIGYELIGGRLLPGEAGPVAQFMYHDAGGQRLTLYVTREAPKSEGGRQADPAFRFGQNGSVNVFYWVDEHFGYAISGGADRQELMRVSREVYRQLTPT